jgi:hypothetical protein
MLQAAGMTMVSRNGTGDSHMNNDSLLLRVIIIHWVSIYAEVTLGIKCFLTNRREGFASKVVEALGFGLPPVLASRMGFALPSVVSSCFGLRPLTL